MGAILLIAYVAIGYFRGTTSWQLPHAAIAKGFMRNISWLADYSHRYNSTNF